MFIICEFEYLIIFRLIYDFEFHAGCLTKFLVQIFYFLSMNFVWICWMHEYFKLHIFRNDCEDGTIIIKLWIKEKIENFHFIKLYCIKIENRSQYVSLSIVDLITTQKFYFMFWNLKAISPVHHSDLSLQYYHWAKQSILNSRRGNWREHRCINWSHQYSKPGNKGLVNANPKEINTEKAPK